MHWGWGPYVRQGPLNHVGPFHGTVGPGETLGLHGWKVKYPECNLCAWVTSEGPEQDWSMALRAFEHAWSHNGGVSV